ncbi:hypothetical protein CISIN_1g0149371mg, partial [Citrus sinensis]
LETDLYTGKANHGWMKSMKFLFTS